MESRPAPAASRPALKKPSQQSVTGGRLRLIITIFVVLSLVLVGRLAWVQVVWGPDLAAQAQEQRARIYVDPARRGEIIDREGNQLAYTMQARSLTVSPVRLRQELRERQDLAMRMAGEQDGLSDGQVAGELDDRGAGGLETMSRTSPA